MRRTYKFSANYSYSVSVPWYSSIVTIVAWPVIRHALGIVIKLLSGNTKVMYITVIKCTRRPTFYLVGGGHLYKREWRTDRQAGWPVGLGFLKYGIIQLNLYSGQAGARYWSALQWSSGVRTAGKFFYLGEKTSTDSVQTLSFTWFWVYPY